MAYITTLETTTSLSFSDLTSWGKFIFRHTNCSSSYRAKYCIILFGWMFSEKSEIKLLDQSLLYKIFELYMEDYLTDYASVPVLNPANSYPTSSSFALLNLPLQDTTLCFQRDRLLCLTDLHTISVSGYVLQRKNDWSVIYLAMSPTTGSLLCITKKHSGQKPESAVAPGTYTVEILSSEEVQQQIYLVPCFSCITAKMDLQIIGIRRSSLYRTSLNPLGLIYLLQPTALSTSPHSVSPQLGSLENYFGVPASMISIK